ncbi:MAG: hypothetical protein ACYSTJ_04190 [Planctomycetota bacterium]|jgi:hypothetical protein
MICRIGRVYQILFAAFFVVLVARSAQATSTGLNNIPTTDVVPENVLVFQTWGNFAGGEHPEQFVGFKYGLFKDMEFGVDWKANDQPHGHAMLQAKYAFDIEPDLLRGVVGFAELSDNREHNGEWFPFGATSLDFKTFRLHFGYAGQPHNERFFGGIDKTVSFLDRNLMLRFDGIHINDKEDMLFSAGFLYELWPHDGGEGTQDSGVPGALDSIARNMALESWVSLPSDGEKEVYTVKLNYVIKF